jgi:hypothetical protein
MGWTAKVQFLARARDFSLLHSVQTSSGAHPASYPVGVGGSFPWGCEGEYSHPSSVKVKNGGVISPFPHTSSWCVALSVKHRDNFTLPLPHRNILKE